ncbi:MAG: glycosyltransferase family 87 protein [Myxococcales bacterium]|nr:glycosyltransferase family 87 protein [Myxococcales bacterium]
MSHAKAYGAFLIVLVAAVVLARRHPRGPDSVVGWAKVLLLGCLGAGAVTWATDTPWFGDYESAYYPAGKLIFSAPAELYGSQCAFGFVNLPLLAVPFVPFSLFAYPLAVSLFTLVGLLCIATSARSLANWSARSRGVAALIFALFVVNGPLWYSVREGNSTHIVLLMLIVALGLLRSDRDGLAGVVLGLAAVVKLPLVLFVGYFGARLRVRAVLGFVSAVAAIVALSVAVHGLPLHQMWIEQCIVPYAGKPVAAFNVQSLTGFLARLYGGSTYEWTPAPIGGSFQLVQRGLSLLLAGVVAGVFLRAGRPRSSSEMATEFSAFLVFLLLFSPLSWTHYFLLALIPLALLMGGDVELPRSRALRVTVWATAFACSLPLRGFDMDMPGFRFVYDRLLSSHHFYGGVLLLGILLYARMQQRAGGARVAGDAPLGGPG